jgi:hypothetical protein
MSLAHAQQGTPPAAPAKSPAASAGLTGTWSGTLRPMVDGQSKGDESAMMVLKQDGDVITGTAGPDAGQQLAIAKGKITTTKEGTAVTFEVTAGSGMVLQFDLKLVDGHLKGGAKAERDGQKMTAEVDVTKTK